MPCLSDALVRYQHARQPGMSRRLVEDTVPCFVAMGAPRVLADTCRAWLKQGAGDDASIAIRQHPRQERALEANAFGHGAETLACTDPSGRDAPDTKPEGIQPRPRQRLPRWGNPGRRNLSTGGWPEHAQTAGAGFVWVVGLNEAVSSNVPGRADINGRAIVRAVWPCSTAIRARPWVTRAGDSRR